MIMDSLDIGHNNRVVSALHTTPVLAGNWSWPVGMLFSLSTQIIEPKKYFILAGVFHVMLEVLSPYVKSATSNWVHFQFA